MLLCMFNAGDQEVRIVLPEGFSQGRTFMDTVIEDEYVVLAPGGSAFVLADTPEEPEIQETPEETEEETKEETNEGGEASSSEAVQPEQEASAENKIPE